MKIRNCFKDISLFPVFKVFQYWVTKVDGHIQSIQCGAFCMALLQQTAVSFSPTSQSTSAQRGKGVVNWVYNCCPSLHDGYCSPIWGKYSVMWYVATLNTNLTTNQWWVQQHATVDQWRIVHWKWQEIRLEGKAGTSFSETVRGKDAFVALPTG